MTGNRKSKLGWVTGLVGKSNFRLPKRSQGILDHYAKVTQSVFEFGVTCEQLHGPYFLVRKYILDPLVGRIVWVLYAVGTRPIFSIPESKCALTCLSQGKVYDDVKSMKSDFKQEN